MYTAEEYFEYVCQDEQAKIHFEELMREKLELIYEIQALKDNQDICSSCRQHFEDDI